VRKIRNKPNRFAKLNSRFILKLMEFGVGDLKFFLASFHEAAGEAGFPALRSVPRAFGKVLGLGAGTAADEDCCQT